MIVIDFETQSRCEIRKTNPSVYAQDKSTRVLCLAYRIGDQPVKLWTPDHDHPDDLLMEVTGQHVHAHNVAFERSIWHHVCHKRLGWPDVPFDNWRCSMAACCRLALPRRLAEAGAALGLDVQKDAEGHRLMLRLSKPRKKSKNNQAEWFTQVSTWAKTVKQIENEETRITDELGRLYEYCRNDVLAESALIDAIPPLTDSEFQVWQLDQRVNLRGVPIDREAVEHSLAVIQQWEQSCKDELAKLTGGSVRSPKQVAKLRRYLESEHSVDLPDLTAGTVTAALDGDKLPETARRVLELRQTTAKSSTAKLKAMINHIDADGRARFGVVYHGAGTGRWSGSGIQPQNFPRPSLSNDEIALLIEMLPLRDAEMIDLILADPMQAVSSALRAMIRAEAGKRLLVCDFASIEARVLAWLTGQTDMVQVFAGGGDIYRVQAAEIYGCSPDDIAKGSEQRQVGKAAVLGLGYGMGPGTSERQKELGAGFLANLKANGIDATDEFAERVVQSYRESNGAIFDYWRALNRAAIKSIKTYLPYRVGLCEFNTQHDWMTITLPSGRQLFYRTPSIDMVPAPWDETTEIDQVTYWSVNSQTRKWEDTRTYGGKLTENIVQAVARDFLVEAILRVEAAGYPVILTVHDEIVSERKCGQGTLAEFERLMSAVPRWGAGCPIAVEGYEAERYRK